MSKTSYAGKVGSGGAQSAGALFAPSKPPRGKVNAAKASRRGAS